MLKPDLYPHAPRSVELRETHISWVFIADGFAYKVKKPIVFPFLDYGTLERRREMCREEVRLNRRLAPKIYLGVVAVTRGPSGFELSSESDPEAVEYAVKMLAVEEHRSLAALAERHGLDPAQVEAVAERLARFHAEAAPAPPEMGELDALAATLDENLTTLGEAGSDTIGPRALEAARDFTDLFLATHGAELAARARAGLVRDGHGDLRAEHVILPSKGGVYVYDCVEFDPALRQIDVAADLAFLVMDMTRLGADAASLVGAYRDAGGDPGDDALLSFFAAYRAWVRAKVGFLRELELDAGDPERDSLGREARELFRLGRRFAWRARDPLVLVVCGVAATGKTTLARALAEASGWSHLSSDVTRKRLAGIAPEERGGWEIYSKGFTIETYRALGGAARAELERGRGAVVDATFHSRDERLAFERGLGGGGPPVLFVQLTAPRDVLLMRARRRALAPERASDAGPAIVKRQLDEFEPLTEVPEGSRVVLAGDESPDELVSEVELITSGFQRGSASAGSR
jgi:aminoglycoside phosphotransferase family enzyme/predicted kinase